MITQIHFYATYRTVTGAGVSGLNAVTLHELSTEDRSPRVMGVGSRFVTSLNMRIDKADSLSCNLQTVAVLGSVFNVFHVFLSNVPNDSGNFVLPTMTIFLSTSHARR